MFKVRVLIRNSGSTKYFTINYREVGTAMKALVDDVITPAIVLRIRKCYVY